MWANTKGTRVYQLTLKRRFKKRINICKVKDKHKWHTCEMFELKTKATHKSLIMTSKKQQQMVEDKTSKAKSLQEVKRKIHKHYWHDTATAASNNLFIIAIKIC